MRDLLGGDRERCSQIVCGDGLSCATGVCDDATGACDYALEPETCLIDGECYDAGDQNRADACQSCDPAIDPEEWSNHTAFVVNGTCATTVAGVNHRR